jgi:hypothetical protein
MENGISDCKGVVYVLDLGDTGQVGKYKRWLLTINHFKERHVSDIVVRCVVPPFIEW